jgi:hypothetical protein
VQRPISVHDSILTTSQAHKAFLLRSYGITGRPQGFPPSRSTASTTVAASDPHVAQLSKFPKPAGLAGSIWATPSVPSTTTVSGSTSLPVSQRQAEKSSTLPRQFQPDSHPRTTSTVATDVEAITTKTIRSLQESLPVSQAPLVKTPTIGSSIPVSSSAHQGNTTGTGSLSRKTDPTHDDFELIEHDDEFVVLDNEGPSAANGIKDPNVLVDGAFSTGWEDDE